MKDANGNEVSVEEVAGKAAAAVNKAKPVEDIPGQTVIAGMEGEKQVAAKPKRKRTASDYLLITSVEEPFATARTMANLKKATHEMNLADGKYMLVCVREIVEVRTATSTTIKTVK